MRKRELERIRKIANRVRRWADKIHKEFKDDCDWWEGLGGMCGICSLYLFKELKNHNIDAYFCERKGHAFVMVDDYVVDVTATQFANHYGKVYIAHVEDAPKIHWGDVLIKIFTGDELYDRFRDGDAWPVEQNPVILQTLKGINYA